jgi:hypothetical protein
MVLMSDGWTISTAPAACNNYPQALSAGRHGHPGSFPV